MKPRYALFVVTGLAIAAAVVSAALPPEPIVDNPKGLVVHEWGTFTSVQDERGQSIGAINVDDEPVPGFVHDIYGLVVRAQEMPYAFSTGGKGFSYSPLRDITMRLETPVVYFHMPAGSPRARVDVSVAFRGGALTQFYPNITEASKLFEDGAFGKFTQQTMGSITWQKIVLGGNEKGPETSDPVWTSPRRVDSLPVTTPTNEYEQFLFYRGVGHLDAPIRVARNGDNLTLHSQLPHAFDTTLDVPSAWLADIREDGTLAYRSVGPLYLAGVAEETIGKTSAHFDQKEYTAGALQSLRQELKGSLQVDGMNADEAEGLLATWEHSYFKTAGLRLLFMVPREWTDDVLPLKVSARDAEVRRAMVGRIEIVSSRQRELIETIAKGPFGGTDWIGPAKAKLNWDGKKFDEKVAMTNLPLTSLGISVPTDYAAYLELGRFRQALVLDRQRHETTPALNAFINAYQLGAPTSDSK